MNHVSESRTEDHPLHAALLLQERGSASLPSRNWSLPLTMTALLATKVRVIFPLREELTSFADLALDDILASMPLESCGIVYDVMPGRADQSQTDSLLLSSVFVITDDTELLTQIRAKGIPHAYLPLQVQAGAALIEVGSVETIASEELRTLMTGCVELINNQAAGITSEGHFSLSW